MGGNPTFCFHMARIEVRWGRAMISDRSARPLDAPSPPANGKVIDNQLRGSRPYVAFGVKTGHVLVER